MTDQRNALKLELFHLPEGWSWRWLDEIMDIRGGAQPPASTFLSHPAPGYIRFIQIRDFDDDAHLTFIEDSPKWRKCAKDDVLIARYGVSLGRILRGLEGAYNVALVKAIPKDVDLDFLHYLLKSRYFQVPLAGLGARSVQSGFNKTDLATIPVPVPAPSEQRAIAHILGTLDDKIALNRRMNETLEAIARAIFKSWFVDFDPVRAKADGRQLPRMDGETAALFPDAFGKSDRGEGPLGWRTVPLPEAIEINPVRTLRKDCTAPYLDMANMPTRGHTPDAVIERRFSGGMRFMNGDTLVARITPCLENGKTAYVDFLHEGQVGWGSTEYIVLRPKPPLPTEYAYCLARSSGFRDFAVQSMTGSSGRQRVPTDSLMHFFIAVPPEKIAELFGELVRPLFNRAKCASEEARSLGALRDTLLPRLLSGELRVKEAERTVERVV